MRVHGLDGKNTSWDLRESKFPMRSQGACKSKIQFACGQILKQQFPLDLILEEVTVPGEQMYLDFFLPNRRIAVEVQGQQHFDYSPFFHQSQKNFKASVARDQRKQRWCDINDIRLICVTSVNELKTELGIDDAATDGNGT